MRKEYELAKLKKRPGRVKAVKNALKVPVNIRIDATVLAKLKTEAVELGIPYQTLLGSVLYRYVNGGLVEAKKTPRSAA